MVELDEILIKTRIIERRIREHHEYRMHELEIRYNILDDGERISFSVYAPKLPSRYALREIRRNIGNVEVISEERRDDYVRESSRVHVKARNISYNLDMQFYLTPKERLQTGMPAERKQIPGARKEKKFYRHFEEKGKGLPQKRIPKSKKH